MRALLVGWFSFEGMGATAGDLLAADVARSWLTDAGVDVAVAWAPPFSAAVDWQQVNPEAVDAVVFVCGPFGNGPPLHELLHHFRACRLIGLDVTMLEPLHTWNPFDLLIERDSSRRANPDLALAGAAEDVPVVGMVLMREQPEYGERDRHCDVNERLEALVASPGFARVLIDTRLDVSGSLLRTPAEVTSLLARMDVVLTSRLHGLVLALRSRNPRRRRGPGRGRGEAHAPGSGARVAVVLRCGCAVRAARRGVCCVPVARGPCRRVGSATPGAGGDRRPAGGARRRSQGAGARCSTAMSGPPFGVGRLPVAGSNLVARSKTRMSDGV